MKHVKYVLNDNDLYDYHRLQEKLTRFAAEGWHLEKISNLILKFRRGEKKRVRYEITYAAAASAYNSRPTEAEQELTDLCAQAGWELAAAFAQVQVYRNEDPNAPPLETDEVQKYQNIRRNMLKHQVPQQLWMIALFALQFLLFASHWLKDPATTLSSNIMVLVLAMTLVIVIEYTSILIGNVRWLWQAGRFVTAGQCIPPNRFYRSFRWVMWISSGIYLLALLFFVEPGYGLAILILAPVSAVTSLGTLAITKRCNASRRVNFWAPALVSMVVILASRPIISNFLIPEEPPQAQLPLTLTQLTGENSGSHLTIGVNSSPLVSHGRYYDFGAENQIQYTLVDVHCPLFYDMILDNMEQDYIRYRDYQMDAVLTDELQEILGADYLRRTTGSGHDQWFICWDDRIVDLYADWVLTDDQIAALAEILKP